MGSGKDPKLHLKDTEIIVNGLESGAGGGI